MAYNIMRFIPYRRSKPAMFIPQTQVVTAGSRGWLSLGKALYPAKVHHVNYDGSLVIEYFTADHSEGKPPKWKGYSHKSETLPAWRFEKVD